MCMLDEDRGNLVTDWDVSGVPPEHKDGLYISLRDHLDARPWIMGAKTILIEKQPDIIKVVLPKFLEPGETTTLFLSYVIKIPDSKFTGMGINDNGRVYLNHWNISVAPFIKGSWLLTSNLDLNDFSGNPANYVITWHYPKNYFLKCLKSRI